MPHDIIYILKDNITTDELKYSLRSVEANFPHRYVFFVGGQPKGLRPDIAVKHQQIGDSKWAMIKSSLWKAVNTAELSEDFFLFNDVKTTVGFTGKEKSKVGREQYTPQ